MAEYNVNDLKLQGTILDRRRKLSEKERKQLVELYLNKKENNLTNKQICARFGVNKSQIWRYMNYNKYLKLSLNDSKNYYNKNKEKRKDINKANRESTLSYKKDLLLVLEKYEG